jgi:hypothetical protein
MNNMYQYKPVVISRGNFIILLQNGVNSLVVRYNNHIHSITTIDKISHKDKHYECYIDGFMVKGLSNFLTYKLDDKSISECDYIEVLSVGGVDPNLTNVVRYSTNYDAIYNAALKSKDISTKISIMGTIGGIIVVISLFVFICFENLLIFVFSIMLAFAYFIILAIIGSKKIIINQSAFLLSTMDYLKLANSPEYVKPFPSIIINTKDFKDICSLAYNFSFRYNGKVHYIKITGDPKGRGRLHKYVCEFDNITIYGLGNLYNYEFEPGLVFGSLDSIEVLVINNKDPKLTIK